MPFVSAGPLRGRIRPGDELRFRLAGCAPGSLIQGIEIFPDGSARPGDGLPVDIIRPGSRALLVGIGSNQAGIERKGSPVDQPFGDAAPDHSLEQLAQQIAIAEAATLDLSHVSYVATANSLDQLPGPLRDRFRVILFPKPSANDLDALLPAVL